MRLSDAGGDYILYVKHELGYSPRTVEIYQSRFRHFAERWLPANGYPDADLTAFTASVLRRYLYAESARGLRPRTIRGLFCPLLGLGEFLIKQKVLTDNPVRLLKMPKMDAAERVLALDNELVALMDAVERQADPRAVAFHRAVFSVLINTGVRAQEMLDIRVGHVSVGAKTILVAHGKGDKSRTLHPQSETLAAISEWLIEREKMGCTHDYLWAITVTRRLGYDGLRALLEETKARAGLADHDNIKCHAIRRAFATRMMTRGSSIKAIQAAMGHSQAETTFKYLFLTEQEAKVMADTGALSRPAPPAPTQPDPPSQAQGLVKTLSRAAFHSTRRRTPAK